MFPLLLTLGVAYAAMHALFYRAVRAAFLPSRWIRVLLRWLLAALFCAALVTRWLDHAGHERLALLLGFAGYTWMAGLLWFCMLWLVLLWMRGIARWRLNSSQVFSTRRMFYASSILVLLLGFYGWHEAHALRVEQIHIPCTQFPAGRPPLRIALISDLHLDLHRNQRLLAQTVKQLRALRPDLILSAGDLVDSPHCIPLADQLAAVSAPLGKYAVLGNHEYYFGLKFALEFHRRAGFTLLRQTARELAPGLWLAGVDDSSGDFFHQPCFDNARLALAGVPADACVILLRHNPRSKGRLPVDLILSGHTHGGQIFPFHLLVRALFPCLSGLHQLDARTRLYITRGVGTWGPPFRLLAPPEITLLILAGAQP